MNINWKSVILDVGDDDLRKLYVELNKADNIRDTILQLDNAREREILYKEYKAIVDEITNTHLIERQIIKLKDKIENRDVNTGYFSRLIEQVEY